MTPWVGKVSAIAIVLFCGVAAPAGMPENGLPQTLWSNVPDYTMMWWMHGLRDERKVFAIQTSRWALAFDVPAFQLTHLIALRKGSPTRNDALGGPNPPSEVAALTLQNEALFGPSNAALVCSLRADGSTCQATGASQDFTDSHLIESGKSFQRRTVNKIASTEGVPIRESSLEIAAWPDRLTLWLRVTPQRAIAQGELALVLEATDEFTVAAEPGDVKRDRAMHYRPPFELERGRVRYVLPTLVLHHDTCRLPFPLRQDARSVVVPGGILHLNQSNLFLAACREVVHCITQSR